MKTQTKRNKTFGYNDPLPTLLRNLTQEKIRKGEIKERKEIAAAIGVSPAAITRYLNGDTGLSTDTLAKFAKFFDCSTDYLLGLDEIRKRSNDSEENMARYLALNVKTIKLLHEGSNSSTRLLFEHILDSTVSKMAQEFLDLSKNGATIEIGRPENSLDDPIADYIENGNIRFGDDTPLDMSLSILHEENKMLKEKGE